MLHGIVPARAASISQFWVSEHSELIWRFHWWTSSSLRLQIPSLAPNPLNIGLGATEGSGHRMPSTHPSGTWLARHWVAALYTSLSGTSLSHPNEVSSARVDWAGPSFERDSHPKLGGRNQLGDVDASQTSVCYCMLGVILGDVVPIGPSYQLLAS